MNIYEQEIFTIMSKITERVEHGQVPLESEMNELIHLVEQRTGLLIYLRDQLIASEMVTKNLISELESADLDMEDMGDFISTLRQNFGSV